MCQLFFLVCHSSFDVFLCDIFLQELKSINQPHDFYDFTDFEYVTFLNVSCRNTEGECHFTPTPAQQGWPVTSSEELSRLLTLFLPFPESQFST